MSTVIVGYARTPFVKYTGQFASVPATELGAAAIRAALERAGGGRRRGRPGVRRTGAAGCCGPESGSAVRGRCRYLAQRPRHHPQRRVPLGHRGRRGGRAAHRRQARPTSWVAVGQESMSLAPHAWSGSRAGKRYGAIELIGHPRARRSHRRFREAFHGVFDRGAQRLARAQPGGAGRLGGRFPLPARDLAGIPRRGDRALLGGRTTRPGAGLGG